MVDLIILRTMCVNNKLMDKTFQDIFFIKRATKLNNIIKKY